MADDSKRAIELVCSDGRTVRISPCRLAFPESLDQMEREYVNP